MTRSRLRDLSPYLTSRASPAPAAAPEPQPAEARSAARANHMPREVRLIGGQWKRSKLPVVNAESLRPTPDRVRETLFNWLGQDLDGWRCLDAFSGSGALGFEAASRGATEVTLIERDTRLVKSLKQVQERLKATQVRIEAADALAWMSRSAPGCFELVFIDPPFGADVFDAAMKAAQRLVVPGGFVYLEADRPFAADAFAPSLKLHRHARAGAVHAHLFQRESPGYTAPELPA